MHVAIITAGGAGMFCGSCMHDNTWARALRAQGTEVTLIPTYTPLRLDEQDESLQQVYLGGINVYLDYRWPLWQRIPRSLTRWLDAPWIINLASRIGISNEARQLGELTMAMLEGESGPQRREVDELVAFLTSHGTFDVICFSNALLVGALRQLKQRYRGRVYCLLQGDDVFIENLPEPHRSRAIQRLGERAQDFDGFLVHSDYYRDFMSQYLSLPREKFHRIPLGIDLEGYGDRPRTPSGDTFTIGYFARICPEKGLLGLAEAFRILHARRPGARLKVGGYLGHADRGYFQQVLAKVGDLGEAFEYVGSPQTRREKLDFLQTLDVLSVPTVYREPKGLYVLEALASGVPVVQPRHGAFPELIETTGGGLLVTPDDPEDLARALEELMTTPGRRDELSSAGRTNVGLHYDARTMAAETLKIFAATRESAHVHSIDKA